MYKGQDQNGGEEARRSFPPPVTSRLNSSNSCFSLQGGNHDDLRNQVPALNPFAQASPAPRSGETLSNPHSRVFSIEKSEEGEISMIEKIKKKVEKISKKISKKQNQIKLSPTQKRQRRIQQVFDKAEKVKKKHFKTEYQQTMLNIFQKEKAEYLRKKQIEKSNQLINLNKITRQNTMNPKQQLYQIYEFRESPEVLCNESPQLFPSNVLGCPPSEGQQSSKRKLIKASQHSIVVEKKREQGFNHHKRRRLDEIQDQNQ